jgi:hypothetical protein
MFSRCCLGHDLRSVPHGFACSRPGCGHVVYRVASLRLVDDRKPPLWMYAVLCSLLGIGSICVVYGLTA